MTWLLVLAIVIPALYAVWLIVNLHPKHYVTEYLFFTRYSLIFGAILFYLPIAGPILAPAMLSNVFDMGWKGAIMVGLAATLHAWAVVYTFRLTRITIPMRCELPFARDGDSEVEAKAIAEQLSNDGYTIVSDRLAAKSLILTAPLFIQVTYRAAGNWWWNFIGLLIGVFVAVLLRFALHMYLSRKQRSQPQLQAESWISNFQPRTIPDDAGVRLRVVGNYHAVADSFGKSPAMKIVHGRAFYFFLGSFVVVALLGVAYLPLFSWSASLPAIVILLCLLIMLTWISGRIGFIFDRARVPVAAVLIIVGILVQLLIPNSHKYEVQPWPETVRRFSADEALSAWIETHGTDKPLVAIAASGGGIRAAYWTTITMEHLNNDAEFDQNDGNDSDVENEPGFLDRIALISSVSGGSLGSMYYLERNVFDPHGQPRASVAAGTSSLSATVWGLTYLETPRLVFGNALGKLDRGWAQEATWGQLLCDADRTLSSLTDRVMEGRYPLPIFNACLQETGQRYVMSPVHILAPDIDLTGPLTETGSAPSGNSAKAKPKPAFQDLLTDLNGDMRVVTAARLSATFPYVSPQARAEFDSSSSTCAKTKFYHAADGGYADNSGLLTTIEVLDRYLEKQTQNKTQTPGRIALVEIRAAPGDFAEPPEAASGGLVNELFGPLLTVSSVQFNSQSSRNRQEIKWLGQLWKKRNDVTLRHFVFYLSSGPLSWHLTDDEKALIRSHWSLGEDKSTGEECNPARDAAHQHNQNELNMLRDFMRSK